MSYDVERVRAQFPTLQQEVNGKPLAYLDSAASAQRPEAVISAISRYYQHDHSNVHRGVHTLSQRATAAYEDARTAVAEFLSVQDEHEVVFTKGTTDALNLLAHGLCEGLKPGDNVVITELEHHSNIVPWQLAAARKGFEVRAISLHDDGSLNMESAAALIDGNTRVLSFNHISNALGTINPVRELVAMGHAVGATVVVDGAQGAVHGPVDVGELGCDAYCFSGHKVYAPTGTGALWAKRELLERIPPYQGGGDMVDQVSLTTGTTWAEIPAKFEAGTPNIAGAVGLAAGLRWFSALGREEVAAWEAGLLAHGTELLQAIEGVRLIGTAPNKAGVLSFVVDGVHAQDLGTLLDAQGIAVRTGHHCAQPAMARFGVTSTTRASIAAYTTHEELERLASGVKKAIKLLA